MNNIYIVFFKMNYIFDEKYMSYFLRFNTMLYKKNGYSKSLELSTKHKKQNNRMIKEKEFKRHTYCKKFDNIIDDDTQ